MKLQVAQVQEVFFSSSSTDVLWMQIVLQSGSLWGRTGTPALLWIPHCPFSRTTARVRGDISLLFCPFLSSFLRYFVYIYIPSLSSLSLSSFHPLCFVVFCLAYLFLPSHPFLAFYTFFSLNPVLFLSGKGGARFLNSGSCGWIQLKRIFINLCLYPPFVARSGGRNYHFVGTDISPCRR